MIPDVDKLTNKNSHHVLGNGRLAGVLGPASFDQSPGSQQRETLPEVNSITEQSMRLSHLLVTRDNLTPVSRKIKNKQAKSWRYRDGLEPASPLSSPVRTWLFSFAFSGVLDAPSALTPTSPALVTSVLVSQFLHWLKKAPRGEDDPLSHMT